MTTKEAYRILSGPIPSPSPATLAGSVTNITSWEEHESLLAKVREHVMKNKIFLAELIELVDDLKAEEFINQRSW